MGFFSGLAKLGMDLVETPIAIVKDVATLGGVLTDQDECYTKKQLENLQDDWDKMKESLEEDD